ncbi:MAG TPA: hypothetical protein VIW25_15290 [Nitrososphaeraceae archaeon]
MVESTGSEQLDPWSLYIYAMKAPMTRDRYETRLAKFLDFIGMLQGGTTTLEGGYSLTSPNFGRKNLYCLV